MSEHKDAMTPSEFVDMIKKVKEIAPEAKIKIEIGDLVCETCLHGQMVHLQKKILFWKKYGKCNIVGCKCEQLI